MGSLILFLTGMLFIGTFSYLNVMLFCLKFNKDFQVWLSEKINRYIDLYTGIICAATLICAFKFSDIFFMISMEIFIKVVSMSFFLGVLSYFVVGYLCLLILTGIYLSEQNNKESEHD